MKKYARRHPKLVVKHEKTYALPVRYAPPAAAALIVLLIITALKGMIFGLWIASKTR